MVNDDMLKLARERVAKGVEWLDKKAAHDMRFRGWRLEMMCIRNGRVDSRVRMAYNTENPLTLAMKWESGLANGDGYVTWATVVKEFGFAGVEGAREAQNLGFLEGDLSSEILDRAWSEALGNYQTRLRPFVLEFPALTGSCSKQGRLEWLMSWAFA